MKRAHLLAVFSTAAFSAVSLAQTTTPTFAGTWKVNLAKSHLGGTSYTLSKTPAGLMRMEGGGYTAEFDLTGKEFPMPDGSTAAGSSPNPNTLDLTMRRNGKVTVKSHALLYGDSAVWVSTIVKPDGQTIEQRETDKRASGGPGWLGKWTSGETTGAPTRLTITLTGATSIMFTSPDGSGKVDAKFDGKYYPYTASDKPTTMTMSFEKVSATEFKTATTMGGKPFATDVFRLSADGKTLTDEQTAVATGEKTTTVFEKP